jgi:glyoxylase-like metal-dependent hydrolase (beta-lactamase superfamily II)
MTSLSRRLLGSAILAAPLLGAALASTTTAAATTGATTGAPPPIIRRRVGRFEVSFLLDGWIDLPYAIFTGIEPATLEQAARGLHIARPTGVRSAFTHWLNRAGRHPTLVDAGPAGTVSPTSGRLPRALAALGVEPGRVDVVIATHLHVDHIAGLVSGGRRVFPNAEVFADRRDVAHFTDPAKAAAAPDLLKSSFQATSELVRLYPRLQRTDGARTIIPGVTTFDLAGHTPGQVGVRIEDGGESLLLVADMLFHPGLHPAHPGIGILFEQDRAAADASRARFFDQAASEGAPLAATHMPFPGVGRIMRTGGGLAWLPADFDYAA